MTSLPCPGPRAGSSPKPICSSSIKLSAHEPSCGCLSHSNADRWLPRFPPATADRGIPRAENLLCVRPNGSDSRWCLRTPRANCWTGSRHQWQAALLSLRPSIPEHNPPADHFHPSVVAPKAMIGSSPRLSNSVAPRQRRPIRTPWQEECHSWRVKIADSSSAQIHPRDRA